MKVSGRLLAIILVGVVVSGLFLFLGLRELSQAPEELPRIDATTSDARDSIVAKAARPIEVGETITGEMVVNVPFDPARHGTIATPAELIGKVAVRSIAADALVDRSWVDLQSNLAMRVPVGKRAVSIDTNSEIAVAGLLRPGNTVDVQVVYPGADAIIGARLEGRSRTETVLQAVQVLAVGETVLGVDEQGGLTGGAASPARTVTLALTPEEVAAFSLAKSTGTILLSLRNPGDDSYAPAFTAVSQYAARSDPGIDASPAPISMRRPARTAVPRPKAEPAAKVELVIAGRRETLSTEVK